MQVGDFNLVCWNVRGLNSMARCLVVHETLKAMACHIVCLQETKLSQIDRPDVFLRGLQTQQFHFQTGARHPRGVLVLWDDNYIELHNIQVASFSITGEVKLKQCGSEFRLSTVYSPSRREHKDAFLRHL